MNNNTRNQLIRKKKEGPRAVPGRCLAVVFDRNLIHVVIVQRQLGDHRHPGWQGAVLLLGVLVKHLQRALRFTNWLEHDADAIHLVPAEGDVFDQVPVRGVLQ